MDTYGTEDTLTRPTRTGRTRRTAPQADGLPVDETTAASAVGRTIVPNKEREPDQEEETPEIPAEEHRGEPLSEARGRETGPAARARRVSPQGVLMALAAAAQAAASAHVYRAYFNQMLGGVYAQETVGILAGYLSYSADMLTLLCPPAALMAVAAGTGDKGGTAALAASGIDVVLALASAAMLSDASGQSAIKLAAAFLAPAALSAASLLVGRRRV